MCDNLSESKVIERPKHLHVDGENFGHRKKPNKDKNTVFNPFSTKSYGNASSSCDTFEETEKLNKGVWSTDNVSDEEARLLKQEYSKKMNSKNYHFDSGSNQEDSILTANSCNICGKDIDEHSFNEQCICVRKLEASRIGKEIPYSTVELSRTSSTNSVVKEVRKHKKESSKGSFFSEVNSNSGLVLGEPGPSSKFNSSLDQLVSDMFESKKQKQPFGDGAPETKQNGKDNKTSKQIHKSDENSYLSTVNARQNGEKSKIKDCDVVNARKESNNTTPKSPKKKGLHKVGDSYLENTFESHRKNSVQYVDEIKEDDSPKMLKLSPNVKNECSFSPLPSTQETNNEIADSNSNASDNWLKKHAGNKKNTIKNDFNQISTPKKSDKCNDINGIHVSKNLSEIFGNTSEIKKRKLTHSFKIKLSSNSEYLAPVSNNEVIIKDSDTELESLDQPKKRKKKTKEKITERGLTLDDLVSKEIASRKNNPESEKFGNASEIRKKKSSPSVQTEPCSSNKYFESGLNHDISMRDSDTQSKSLDQPKKRKKKTKEKINEVSLTLDDLISKEFASRENTTESGIFGNASEIRKKKSPSVQAKPCSSNEYPESGLNNDISMRDSDTELKSLDQPKKRKKKTKEKIKEVSLTLDDLISKEFASRKNTTESEIFGDASEIRKKKSSPSVQTKPCSSNEYFESGLTNDITIKDSDTELKSLDQPKKRKKKTKKEISLTLDDLVSKEFSSRENTAESEIFGNASEIRKKKSSPSVQTKPCSSNEYFASGLNNDITIRDSDTGLKSLDQPKKKKKKKEKINDNSNTTMDDELMPTQIISSQSHPELESSDHVKKKKAKTSLALDNLVSLEFALKENNHELESSDHIKGKNKKKKAEVNNDHSTLNDLISREYITEQIDPSFETSVQVKKEKKRLKSEDNIDSTLSNLTSIETTLNDESGSTVSDQLGNNKKKKKKKAKDRVKHDYSVLNDVASEEIILNESDPGSEPSVQVKKKRKKIKEIVKNDYVTLNDLISEDCTFKESDPVLESSISKVISSGQNEPLPKVNKRKLKENDKNISQINSLLNDNIVTNGINKKKIKSTRLKSKPENEPNELECCGSPSSLNSLNYTSSTDKVFNEINDLSQEDLKELSKRSKGDRSKIVKLNPQVTGGDKEMSIDTQLLLHVAKDERILSDEILEKLKKLEVGVPWPIPPLHEGETHVGTYPSKETQLEKESLGIPIKKGPFTKEEDKLIKKNFSYFCELHELEVDPKPFMNFRQCTLTPSNRIKFVQFLAHKLDDRYLFCVYQRFCRLYWQAVGQSGRFTEYEDKLIETHINNSKSSKPIYDLSIMLKRSWLSVYRRYIVLLQRYPKVKWTIDMMEDFINHLLNISSTEDIFEFKRREITNEEYAVLSTRMDMPTHKLRRAWYLTIYPRLFSKDNLSGDVIKGIKRKLVTLLYESKVKDLKLVDFADLAKNFEEGISGIKLYTFLKSMIMHFVPDELRDNFRKSIKFLMENFSGVGGRCIPNYVFEDGKLKEGFLKKKRPHKETRDPSPTF